MRFNYCTSFIEELSNELNLSHHHDLLIHVPDDIIYMIVNHLYGYIG